MSQTGRITRQSKSILAVAVDTNIADSDEVEYAQFSGGQIHVRNGSSLTTLTFHTAEKLGGTYDAAYDRTNTAVTQSVAADRTYPIPDEISGCGAFKITGNADGTVDISLKG